MNRVDPTIGQDCWMIRRTHKGRKQYLRTISRELKCQVQLPLHPTPRENAASITEWEWMPSHKAASRFFAENGLCGAHLRLFHEDGTYHGCWCVLDRADLAAIAHRFGGRVVKVYSSRANPLAIQYVQDTSACA